AVPACLVVESFDSFDGERGMQPELVELEPSPGLGWILGPLDHARQSVPFLSRRSLSPLLLTRRTPVKRALGMNVTDEVNIGRQIREDTLAAVSAVTREYDLVVREPFGDQFDEFESQLGPGAMIGVGLGGSAPALLPL